MNTKQGPDPSRVLQGFLEGVRQATVGDRYRGLHTTWHRLGENFPVAITRNPKDYWCNQQSVFVKLGASGFESVI